MWIFQPAKFCRKSTWKRPWIFRPSKLHRKKYVETTQIFFLIIPAPIISKIVVTFSGAILSRISFSECFKDLIELFDFSMTGVSLSYNNKESLKESDIKIVGTDFDSSCKAKNNSSDSVSTSSQLTQYVSALGFFSSLINVWILLSRNSLVTSQ